MREKIMRFMYGRYGYDRFTFVLLILAIVLHILGCFSFRTGIAVMLRLLALVAVGYSTFRIFSRDTFARRKELSAYMRIESFILRMPHKIKAFFTRKKMEFSQRKTHCFFSCPKCNTRVRVPRGKGKICITCPKCKENFVRKT